MSGDNSWSVRDVMSYFGGELENDERAEAVMRRVEIELKDSSRPSYFQLMNQVRDILMRLGYNVPFRAGYRRCK
uniref:Uncharacterized protein n=1 Tax=viral metagenome TaxID=1070528 RepID=A0A6M3KW03_9ZZZZ